MPDISKSKDNQTMIIMKFGQLIRYSVKIFFFENHAENKAVSLVPELFFLFFKILISMMYG